jgi:hypothetical protein
MRLTIIPSDGAVYEDGFSYSGLTWEGTPADVHALQWFDTQGWIEFTDKVKQNEAITELPQWALNAMGAWTVANQPAPQPYASWTLNNETAQWEAPTPYPTDDKKYTWDEATTTWVEVPVGE